VLKLQSACRSYTLRVEITLCVYKSHDRVVITLVIVEITLERIVMTLVSVTFTRIRAKITLVCVEATLCV
jgi:hypothetical protein